MKSKTVAGLSMGAQVCIIVTLIIYILLLGALGIAAWAAMGLALFFLSLWLIGGLAIGIWFSLGEFKTGSSL